MYYIKVKMQEGPPPRNKAVAHMTFISNTIGLLVKPDFLAPYHSVLIPSVASIYMYPS